jgi:hypothetical protein
VAGYPIMKKVDTNRCFCQFISIQTFFYRKPDSSILFNSASVKSLISAIICAFSSASGNEAKINHHECPPFGTGHPSSKDHFQDHVHGLMLLPH